MGRPTRETQHGKRDAFLVAYASLGTITHAAEAAQVDRGQHYRWMDTDPAYPALFAEAGTKAKEAMVREARRRAIEGTAKPVYQGGQRVGTIQEYSDTLLIFLMKGAMPETYRERVDVTILDVRAEAERIAVEMGLDADSVMAEAEAILAKR
jgi:hypothetical protein